MKTWRIIFELNSGNKDEIDIQQRDEPTVDYAINYILSAGYDLNKNKRIFIVPREVHYFY